METNEILDPTEDSFGGVECALRWDVGCGGRGEFRVAEILLDEVRLDTKEVKMTSSMTFQELTCLLCAVLVFAPYHGIAWSDAGTDHQAAQTGTIELGTSGGNIFDSSKSL